MSIDMNNLWLKIKTPFLWRRVWFVVLVVVLVLLALGGVTFAYGYSYKDRVLPGVKVGTLPIGGMEKAELRGFLESMNDKLVNEGLRFDYEINEKQDTLVMYPVVVNEDDSLELVMIDIDGELDYLLGYGRVDSFVFQGLGVLRSRLQTDSVSLQTVVVDEERLLSTLKSSLAEYEILPKDSSIDLQSIAPLKYDITSSSPGIVFDYSEVVSNVLGSWSVLEPVEVEIGRYHRDPGVVEENVESILERLPSVFDDGGLQLTYKDPHTRFSYDWWISQEQIKIWLEVQKTEDGEFGFGLRLDEVGAYLEVKVASVVNVQARNAKFKIGQNDKVIEFQGSRPGIGLEVEATTIAINEAILGRTWHDEGITKSVQLVVEKVEPSVKTGDVNDLGIEEILGIGISDYSRSPSNRIKNIQNAVNKLNGVLIKPGEEFSTLEYTRPFTLEGGYLPELVIKGDEVKPEIGGGLCQIGTTLFRMAMNSAMEITSRRNHSLVVFHYDDPVNGNPGTDATVYDPAPDFRFKNDTDHYILIQTYMNKAKEELAFTIWGNSDGREGSYSRPVVHRWIPYEEEKIMETTKLEPGEEKCQNAFTGADASFVYTRKFVDGTKEEIVYESHYRPLPRICLVGVEEETEEGEESDDCGLEKDCLNEEDLLDKD